jgi:hypothetical protein
MAHMPTFKNPTPTAEQLCRLSQQSTAEEFSRLFTQHFPWLASQQDQKDHGPDQRGFIIGNVRL